MIKAVTIEGFQSHRDTSLKFGKGINVIVGSSDSGKSAVIRALNWVIHNKPAGDFFRTHDIPASKGTTVSLCLTDGEVIRHRSSKANVYRKDGTEYAALKDVPELGIDLNELNVQKQLDPPFMFTASAGEVARSLNSLLDLELIDTATQRINQTVQKTTTDIKTQEALLEQHQQDLKQFSKLSEIRGVLDTGIQIRGQIRELTSSLQETRKIMEETERIGQDLKNCPDISHVFPLFDQAAASAKEQSQLEEQIRIIRDSLMELLQLKGEIEWQEKELNELETSLASELKKGCPLCGHVPSC